MDPDSGLITTAAPLLGSAGDYNITIEVRDGGTDQKTGVGYVIITVLPANNGAPEWVVPSENNLKVTVLEVGLIHSL